VQVPCIAFADGPDTAQLPITLKSSSFDYVIITSPEAAKVFIAGWTVAGKPAVSIACVGTATGDTLRAAGLAPVFTPSKATGEVLAAELPLPASSSSSSSSSASATALYPASAKAPGTVQAGLEARGFSVQRLNTYDTGAARWSPAEAAAAAQAAVATFGSPSAVKAWAAQRGTEAHSALAACIGETSATACRAAGWSEAAVFWPEKPGMEGWVKAVEATLQKAPQPADVEPAVVDSTVD
jgi:uroporphyrinogen-III synthase